MKRSGAPNSDLSSLSERLGQIRRTLFLLESAERLKHLREPRRAEPLPQPHQQQR
jgi:hypothetical protein